MRVSKRQSLGLDRVSSPTLFAQRVSIDLNARAPQLAI